jgi:hypothetical protein
MELHELAIISLLRMRIIELNDVMFIDTETCVSVSFWHLPMTHYHVHDLWEVSVCLLVLQISAPYRGEIEEKYKHLHVCVVFLFSVISLLYFTRKTGLWYRHLSASLSGGRSFGHEITVSGCNPSFRQPPSYWATLSDSLSVTELGPQTASQLLS